MGARILYSRKFLKNFRKRIPPNSNLSKKFDERIASFISDPSNPILKDHQLTGSQKENRSFWITGDIRIIYLPVSKKEALFLDIGSHNQVY